MWGSAEWLELNRDMACIYLVIALTDWITHEGTTRRRRKTSFDKSDLVETHTVRATCLRIKLPAKTYYLSVETMQQLVDLG